MRAARRSVLSAWALSGWALAGCVLVAVVDGGEAAADEPSPPSAPATLPSELAPEHAAAARAEGPAQRTPHPASPTEVTAHLRALDETSRATLRGGALITMWRDLASSSLPPEGEGPDREVIVGGVRARPSASAWAPVAELDAGTTVLGGSRYRPIGPENAGAAVEGWLVVEQRAGALALAAQAMVGRGVGARTDVDAEGVASALVRVAPGAHVGVEARARTEVEDELETEEDFGRPAELVGVGVATWSPVPGLELSTLAGWRSPRGSAAPGPLVLGAIAQSF
jgi:hypothetical protein